MDEGAAPEKSATQHSSTKIRIEDGKKNKVREALVTYACCDLNSGVMLPHLSCC